MSKQSLKLAITAFAGFAVTYLMFAFSEWSINPADWAGGVRGFCAFLGAGMAGMAVIIRSAIDAN